jgi:nucleotide-binding universal stress UspA family protein
MSYNTIIAVINEQSASVVTARYAISLAAACKAELILYAAHVVTCNESLISRTGHHMDDLTTLAAAQGIRVTRTTDVGNIRSLLPKLVVERKVDLVFYHLTPEEQFGTFIRRHTVHHLLRTITSDLAIMRVVAMVKPHPCHILAPFGSGDDGASRRMKFVTQVATTFHAQVTLFHLSGLRRVKKMPESISRFREQLEQQHVTVLERRGTGCIGEAIGIEAITRHNDLIVMGASDCGVFRRIFLGDPAEMVMRHPPCNTILFRPAHNLP